MTAGSDSQTAIQDFIKRWTDSGAAERANYQLFLSELCDALEVPRPNPARREDKADDYVFERVVTFHNPDGTTSAGRIDLYKQGCFVLEAKQGSNREKRDAASRPDGTGSARQHAEPARKTKRGAAVRGTRRWDDAMLAARGQAEQYVRALPATEGNPPFLVVVDVGHSIDLYSDFTRSGKTYVPFPDARSHRIRLEQLAEPSYRERLNLVWTDPLALDPTRRSARVTRDVASRLARLAKSLEESGHAPERVAAFLMRAIFTMFAEDVKLIPAGGFTSLLERLRDKVEIFPQMARSLWQSMNEGGFSPILERELLRFNGGLFESADALPINSAQLDLLIEASRADWKDVEPAIFGTLLERALDPLERHKLGAHYTPRAYVERLVMPTIIEPLREEWGAVQAAAVTLAKSGRLDSAAEEVKAFHHRLCDTRVLDPACGSGNFLYVTLEHMKRLEGEVLRQLEEFSEGQMRIEAEGFTVDPHQLLGIEVNPRAAAIADLVLWIGYLQWHFRTRGDAMPPEPVLKKFKNIECRDAVLAYDRVEQVVDERGEAVTRWDGRTYKKHAVTGEDVPDDTARVAVLKYVNPRKAEWPEADFIIGNPPYIGMKRMRLALNDEYVDILRRIYQDVPDTCDLVMYWWHKAALAVRKTNTKRFGFITTNSIVQAYSRGLVEQHLTAKDGIVIIYAIPDHPWVESVDGAAVRVAMMVGVSQVVYKGVATLGYISEKSESATPGIRKENVDIIGATLERDLGIQRVQTLAGNKDMCLQGVILGGEGFKLELEDIEKMGYSKNKLPKIIKKHLIGRDIVQVPTHNLIIDTFGLSESELREEWPEFYQRLFDMVKPEREHNKRDTRRKNWWLFAENAPRLRRALNGLKRFIATPNTSKHRPFVFFKDDTLPDAMTYIVPSDDAYLLGTLSSRSHTVWAVTTGGTLGPTPRYNNTVTFAPFPFPVCDEQQKAKIRELGEALDAHRKRQQAQHPDLTITDMYNVMEKLRADQPLSAKEKITHERGLVSVLRQIHDELDAAVFDAYGWTPSLTDEEILERLVALNRERAAEERNGLIRWLRPEFQNPQGTAQTALATTDAISTTPVSARQEKITWPKSLPEQARAVRAALAEQKGVVTPEQLNEAFKGGKNRLERISELLRTLASLGQAREVEAGRFAA